MPAGWIFPHFRGDSVLLATMLRIGTGASLVILLHGCRVTLLQCYSVTLRVLHCECFSVTGLHCYSVIVLRFLNSNVHYIILKLRQYYERTVYLILTRSLIKITSIIIVSATTLVVTVHVLLYHKVQQSNLTKFRV